jgi:hypothetical protein
VSENVTIHGVVFQRGDNGQQRYYDHVADNGDYWVVLQPYNTNALGTTPRFKQRKLWWAAHVWPVMSHALSEVEGVVEWRANRVCTLNLCTHYDTHLVKDALYDQTDPGYVDPPMQLLTAIADWIASRVDPFSIERIRCPVEE